MEASKNRVVIVGAGHAGGSVASFLRQYGFAGQITLLGEETVPPYQRPPLSKAWLKGNANADDLLLKPQKYYAEQNIDLRLGTCVSGIDTQRQTVTLASDETLGYDHLVLATGARARKLSIPGHDLGGILHLRDMADARTLQAGLAKATRIGIIGGGYIGLEVAASARALGVEVVILEREPRLLCRVASSPVSTFFQAHHESCGVQFHFDADIGVIEGTDSWVSGIRLTDNSVVDCDLLLIGIGAIPNDDMARSAGLQCDGGIVVDADARTSDQNVFAIGDVTKRPITVYDRMFRLESVPNALEQAKRVACAITGKTVAAPEVPWFWSDQYEVKLQIAGIPFDADRTVVRSTSEPGKFTVFHLRDGRLLAAEAINSPGDFLAAKKGILSGKILDAEQLANGEIPLMSLFA